MESKSFDIYERTDKNEWSSDTIIILIGLICVIGLLVNFYFIKFSIIDSILKILGLASILYFGFRIITSFNKIEKIKARKAGSLKLLEYQISLGNKKFELKKIESIEISINDFEGMRNHLAIKSTNPGLSNGIDNYFKINLRSGKSVEYKFKQVFENEFIRSNKKVLINYSKQGKLSILNLSEILGIDDYNEIQDLKKTIANNGSSQITGS